MEYLLTVDPDHDCMEETTGNVKISSLRPHQGQSATPGVTIVRVCDYDDPIALHITRGSPVGWAGIKEMRDEKAPSIDMHTPEYGVRTCSHPPEFPLATSFFSSVTLHSFRLIENMGEFVRAEALGTIYEITER